MELEKDKLILAKMDTEEAKKKVQQEVTNLMTVREQLVASFNDKIKDIQVCCNNTCSCTVHDTAAVMVKFSLYSFPIQM